MLCRLWSRCLRCRCRWCLRKGGRGVRLEVRYDLPVPTITVSFQTHGGQLMVGSLAVVQGTVCGAPMARGPGGLSQLVRFMGGGPPPPSQPKSSRTSSGSIRWRSIVASRPPPTSDGRPPRVLAPCWPFHLPPPGWGGIFAGQTLCDRRPPMCDRELPDTARAHGVYQRHLLGREAGCASASRPGRRFHRASGGTNRPLPTSSAAPRWATASLCSGCCRCSGA